MQIEQFRFWRLFISTPLLQALVIGLLARAVLPGTQHMGLIMTMILGVVGAWSAGSLAG